MTVLFDLICFLNSAGTSDFETSSDLRIVNNNVSKTCVYLSKVCNKPVAEPETCGEGGRVSQET